MNKTLSADEASSADEILPTNEVLVLFDVETLSAEEIQIVTSLS